MTDFQLPELGKIVKHQAAGSAWIPGMNLLLIEELHWVSGFESVPSSAQGHTLVAMRTLEGSGEIILRSPAPSAPQCIALTPGTVIFFNEADMERFRTTGDNWAVHWYDFVVDETAALPLGRCLQAPVDSREVEGFKLIQSALKDESIAQRRCATALFALQVNRWLACQPPDTGLANDPTACVELAMRVMRNNLHQMIGIDEIAEQAGTSPQTLRKMFARVVGISPKKFYSRMRMNKAYQLLETGKSVSETSALLGFSSPFHFSRAFRAFHLIPPKVKKGKKGKGR